MIHSNIHNQGRRTNSEHAQGETLRHATSRIEAALIADDLAETARTLPHDLLCCVEPLSPERVGLGPRYEVARGSLGRENPGLDVGMAGKESGRPGCWIHITEGLGGTKGARGARADRM